MRWQRRTRNRRATTNPRRTTTTRSDHDARSARIRGIGPALQAWLDLCQACNPFELIGPHPRLEILDMKPRRHAATWGAALLVIAASVALSCSSLGCSSSSDATENGNVCPEGPGTCQNGDSSTCRCGESCVQTAQCAGCGYECVKGCASDQDCAGYFSGDTPPIALSCIGASSSMPVAHCGISASSTSSTTSTSSTSSGGGTPCTPHAGYDHYCIDQGYAAHFNQCDSDQTPASDCENVLLDGVSCGQGGAGGTIKDCYCCP